MSANLPRKTASILTVEDTLAWQEIFKQIFTDSDYLCDYVSSVAEAIEKLRGDSFNIAILDMRLNDDDANNMGGLEILQWLVDNKGNTKVIFCTAYAEIEMARKAFLSGNVVDFISKGSSSVLEMKSIVNKVLGEQKN